MPGRQQAPYGTWRSPITSDLIVAGTIGLGPVTFDGEFVYWHESRPTEGGRTVVVRRGPDGRVQDLTPTPFNARSRVHEYGGGAWLVGEGVLYFSNFADNRLYRVVPDATPEPLTADSARRYADMVEDSRRKRLIAVREDHADTTREAVNTLVGIALDGGPEQLLATGHDFYSNPRLSPDGTRLAWLAWRHPNMPWDGTELYVAPFEPDGSLGPAELVAGGPDESVFQPEWSPGGLLYFVSDRPAAGMGADRWWNLYRRRDGQIEALCPMEAEFGLPQWVFGMATYTFASAEQLICTYTQEGSWHLASLALDERQAPTAALRPIDLPYDEIILHPGPVAHGRLPLVAGSPGEAPAVIMLDLATGQVEVLRRSSTITVDPGYLSIPQAITFPTEGGLSAHAFYYPPANRDFSAPPGTLPPLLVKSHGGPTGATDTALNLAIQYWTSRGVAVLDVNYGGSTGYGRAYRQRLDGQWGVVDVDDCVNGARYLVQRGLADGNRLAIDGGSAGGYTTLCVLTFRQAFKAGASYYGISDLEALAKEGHKFESRYGDRLTGPLPEAHDLYVQRSPIHHVDRIACPLILFQGLEDKVVPPNQAELFYEAVRAKGLPVAYLAFEGEGHGFRQAANIKRALEAELYFFGKVLGFTPADLIEPVPIANLEPGA